MRGFRTTAVLVLVALPGCGLWGGPAAGVVTGLVTYAGKPAAGKRISLTGAEPPTAATDAQGRYTFADVAPGRHQVVFRSAGDAPGVVPNEVAEWRSLAFEVADGSGREVPPIEVAYNGLLAPEDGAALGITAALQVDFHWSAHPRAQRYRVVVEGENRSFKWTGPWAPGPTTRFGQDLPTGHYYWKAEIEAGDAGTGVTRTRILDIPSPGT